MRPERAKSTTLGIVFDPARDTSLAVDMVALQDTYDPAKRAFYFFGGFALVAVIGGALGTVQPPGKKPMTAADWARGARLDDGVRAG